MSFVPKVESKEHGTTGGSDGIAAGCNLLYPVAAVDGGPNSAIPIRKNAIPYNRDGSERQ